MSLLATETTRQLRESHGDKGEIGDVAPMNGVTSD